MKIGGMGVLNYAKHIVNQFVLLHLRVLIAPHLFCWCWDIRIHHIRDDVTFICATCRQNRGKIGGTNWYNYHSEYVNDQDFLSVVIIPIMDDGYLSFSAIL